MQSEFYVLHCSHTTKDIYYNLKKWLKRDVLVHPIYNKNICTYTVLSYFFLFLNSMPILKYI